MFRFLRKVLRAIFIATLIWGVLGALYGTGVAVFSDNPATMHWWFLILVPAYFAFKETGADGVGLPLAVIGISIGFIFNIYLVVRHGTDFGNVWAVVLATMAPIYLMKEKIRG